MKKARPIWPKTTVSFTRHCGQSARHGGKLPRCRRQIRGLNLYKDHNKLNERTRGHMWKICHERARLNLRKESFPNRAVNMWNFLPEYVVNAPSVDSFKNRLDKQWSNEEIVYDYKAAAPAGRKTYAPAGTQDLTIEAN